MQDLTDGIDKIELKVKTIREMIQILELKFPGFSQRIFEGNSIRDDISIIVDGIQNSEGMGKIILNAVEIHFIPLISGG